MSLHVRTLSLIRCGHFSCASSFKSLTKILNIIMRMIPHLEFGFANLSFAFTDGQKLHGM